MEETRTFLQLKYHGHQLYAYWRNGDGSEERELVPDRRAFLKTLSEKILEECRPTLDRLAAYDRGEI